MFKRFFILISLSIIISCDWQTCYECIPELSPKRYNCETIEKDVSWKCKKDGVEFSCRYTHLRGSVIENQ